MKKPDKIEVGQIWGYFPYTIIKILDNNKVLIKAIDSDRHSEQPVKDVIKWDFKGYNAKIMLKERLKREKDNAQQ